MSAQTTISKRRVTAVAVAILGIVLIVSLRPWLATSLGNSTDRDARRGSAQANESSAVSSDLVEPPLTKSRIRTHHPKPTIEETTALSRTMIISGLDLPTAHPVPAGIARLNELIQQAGVEPYRLRLRLRSADPANQRGIRYEFKISEAPLAITLKYFCGASNLRYHVRENGIIELTTLQDQDPIPDLPDSPGKAARLPSDKTDAFGNNLDASEGPDPFAAPSTR